MLINPRVRLALVSFGAGRCTHRLLSEFVVQHLQALVGIVQFPLGLLSGKRKVSVLPFIDRRDITWYIHSASVCATHGVSGDGQALLDEGLKRGL